MFHSFTDANKRAHELALDEEEGGPSLNEHYAQGCRRKRPRISNQERLLVVGAACVDVVDILDAFPSEDSENRSKRRLRRLGGNGANLARVAVQFKPLKVTLLYATSEETLDPGAAFARGALRKTGVQAYPLLTCVFGEDEAGQSDCSKKKNFDVTETGSADLFPSSYILQCNGSRTIVTHRNLPEITCDLFASVYVPMGQSWIHFEGRDFKEVAGMMQHVASACTVSLELEKERSNGDVMGLVRFADVVMISRSFCIGRGFSTAADLFKHLKERKGELQIKDDAKVVVPWGEEGAYGFCFGDAKGQIFVPVPQVSGQVVDTVGAGDCFNAALISSLMQGEDLESAIHFGCTVASRKTRQQGLAGLV